MVSDSNYNIIGVLIKNRKNWIKSKAIQIDNCICKLKNVFFKKKVFLQKCLLVCLLKKVDFLKTSDTINVWEKNNYPVAI